MRRDPDLIRALLLEAEGENPRPDMSPWTNEQKAYHTILLIEAGLIKGSATETHYKKAMYHTEAERLTWEGHEFLDSARENTIWAKAKAKLMTSGVSWTFQILGEMLKSEIRKQLGEKAD